MPNDELRMGFRKCANIVVVAAQKSTIKSILLCLFVVVWEIHLFGVWPRIVTTTPFANTISEDAPIGSNPFL